MTWPNVSLGDLSNPKQWPILSRAQMGGGPVPVFGANGIIGSTSRASHASPTVIVGCRGSCGTVHLTPPNAYVNGNAMAIDDLDETRMSAAFLAQYLAFRGFADVITGSSQPQITRQNIVRVDVVVPPIEEQRRISAILDHAEVVRAKRRRSMALLESLVSTTVEAAVRGGSPQYVQLGELTTSLRNGLSPSTSGRVAGRVLTLSSITRGSFDPLAAKDALFDRVADADQRVGAITSLKADPGPGRGEAVLPGIAEKTGGDGEAVALRGVIPPRSPGAFPPSTRSPRASCQDSTSTPSRCGLFANNSAHPYCKGFGRRGSMG